MAEVLQALVDAGATAEQLVAAVRAEEAARVRVAAEAQAERRAQAAQRQRAKRARDAGLAPGQGELALELAAPCEANQADAAQAEPAQEAGDGASRGVTDVTRDSPFLSPSPSPRPPSTTPNLSQLPPIVPQNEAEEPGSARRSRSRRTGSAKAAEPAPAGFEAAWAAYPHSQGRSSRPKALAEWRRLEPAVQAMLPAAAARYRAEGREPKMDCGAKAFELWLRDARYLDWMGPAAGAAGAGTGAGVTVSWPGPEAFRRDAVAAAGESFVRAYLDPSGWREGGEDRAVLARTGTAAERMTRELRPLLARHGLTVRHERVLQ